VDGGQRVHFEILRSVGVPAGRDHCGLGTDHIKDAAHNMCFFVNAVGAPDRVLVASSLQYTVGTRDSSVSERADRDRIATFSDEFADLRDAGGLPRRVLPATCSDHVEVVLERRAAAKQMVRNAGDDGSLPQTTAQQMLKCGFSDIVILGEMPYGPAKRRSQLAGDVGLAGDDLAALAALTGAGLKAVARCGDRTVTLAEEAFRNRQLKEVSTHGLADFKYARPLGLRPEKWGRTYHWWADQDLLLAQDTGAKVETFTAWRTVNLIPQAAVLLAAIEEETWPAECIERSGRMGGWGRVTASSLRSQGALRAVLHVADAALIGAERRMFRERG